MAHCVRCCCWLLVLTLLALTVTAAVVFVRNRNGGQVFPIPGVSGSVDHKYAEALAVALQFFQVQKSGKLVNNEIPWRGDSALDDGQEAGLDLSKGMYDAGDHIKFGFPMAFTATMLSWSVLEYGDAMRAAKQWDSALDAVKWIMDYLVNAHPSDNVLYIQINMDVAEGPIEDDAEQIVDLEQDDYRKYADEDVKSIVLNTQMKALSRHNKPKKSNNAKVLPQDYECTKEDVDIIAYMKATPEKRVLVNIDNNWVNRDDMDCLFRDGEQVNGAVLSAYIHCIRHEEHLQHREDGQLYVALSRGVSRQTTRILAKPKKEVDTSGKSTKNIVYKDVLAW